MKKISFSTAGKNIRKNFLLLISSMSSLLLFLHPSLLSMALTTAIFVAVVIAAAFNIAKPTILPVGNKRVGSILIASLIAYVGFDNFNKAWTPSSKVAALAGALGTTSPVFLLIVGAVGCIVGLYAMYVLSCQIVSLFTKVLQERLPAQGKAEVKVNLKQNWYFPISAVAFFSLHAQPTTGYRFSLLIAFILSIFLSSQISSIWKKSKNTGIPFRILSLITSIGICLAGQSSFHSHWSVSSIFQALEAALPIAIDVPEIIGTFCRIIAIPFIYYCVLLFLTHFAKVVKEAEIFSEVKKSEWIVYGILLTATLGYMVFFFAQSQVVYGTAFGLDVIYTSDSSFLVKENIYLALTHIENDLRQPLFSVFAAPFVGIPYLLASIFGASATVRAILMNSAQILMLFFANFMLAKTLKLDPIKRICFMLLTSCTYTHLLFAVMMEQYIVAYFWLVLSIYFIAEKKQPQRITLWGAGGTLLTSMVLLPFISAKPTIKNFKAWVMEMVKYGFEFVLLMLVFCRFDVIFDLMPKITSLNDFTGKAVAFSDKIYQYTEFIASCFIAPNAGVNTDAFSHISWQLNAATGIRFAGIFILVLVVISAVWNHDKKSSLLSAGWVGFSIIILVGLGWGTQENGLILYALYFGWAFFVLLFQLVEKIESKLKIKFLIPVITIAAVTVLLMINIPAIKEMLSFATTYYPV